MDEDDDYDGGVALVEEPTPIPSSDKRKRKREKEKLNKQKSKKAKDGSTSKKDGKDKVNNRSTATETVGGKDEPVNEEMARMEPRLIADYVAQRLKRFEKDLSSVELEDQYISQSAFLDTTSFTSPRTLHNLPAYLEFFSTFALVKSSQTPGTPHTLILTSAALRATDLARAVRKYQTKASMVAKLFAKHIKLKESVSTCTTSRIGIGVGTPGRILDLLKEGALKVGELRNVIIDASHVDKKNFGIFDVKETQRGLMEVLGFETVKERLGDKTMVLFY